MNVGVPRRIDMSLLDEELRDLVDASSKIFPITQNDVDTNSNPNGYEYGRVDNHIYRWNGSWEYIIANDVDIKFSELKEIPGTFKPSAHTHTEVEISNLDKYTKLETDNKLSLKADKVELHTHTNKVALDTVTQVLIDNWNTISSKSDKDYVDLELSKKSNTSHNHDTIYDTIINVDSKLSSKSNIIHNHDGAYYKKSEVDGITSLKSDKTHKHVEADITNLDKYTKLEVDNKLAEKTDLSHTHLEADITDLDKYTKSEIDSMLLDKSPSNHSHTELHNHPNKAILDKLIETEVIASYDLSNLKYIEDIKNGYTEGHSHTNLTVLNGVTDVLISGWNEAFNHTIDSVKHITASERTLWNTVSDKANSIHTHDYSPISHNHNTLYNTKTEITTLLNGKSDSTHTHADKADKTYVDTELSKKSNSTHTHTDKADKTYVDSELGSKVATTTFNGHTGNSTVHVTQTNKDLWNDKADISDIPTKLSELESDIEFVGRNYDIGEDVVPPILVDSDMLGGFSSSHYLGKLVTISPTKPTDGSIWYKEI